MKLWLKISLWIVGILVGLGISTWIAFQVSPYPSALIIRRMFSGPVEIKDKETYAKAEQKVEWTKDYSYTSKYDTNTFDLYMPKNVEGKVPVMVWAHGGGFVGGDKSGMVEYSTYVAADSQIAVVSMNYKVAPDLNYPGQVTQMGELVDYLKKNQEKFPQLDMTRVLVGGDSAGAQIAGQYAVIQTNADYAKENKLKQTLSKDKLLAFISYSGPVNLIQMKEANNSNRTMQWFVNSVGWSLLGKNDWKDSKEIGEASMVKHVTKDFPKTYITDGNAFSFQEQGQSLDKKLQELGVPVSSLFYTEDKKQITHEYQFNYDTKEAKEAYKQTNEFLQSVLK